MAYLVLGLILFPGGDGSESNRSEVMLVPLLRHR
jgi:hypothetical protein